MLMLMPMVMALVVVVMPMIVVVVMALVVVVMPVIVLVVMLMVMTLVAMVMVVVVRTALDGEEERVGGGLSSQRAADPAEYAPASRRLVRWSFPEGA